MGAGGVVLLAPGIQGGLEFLDRLKRAMHIQQFSLEGLVQAFDLPGGGRGVDLGEPVSDPVLPADPVKQHLHRHAGLVEPAGEHLAVVGQHLLGHPVDAHRVHERLADWAGGGPHHRLGDHAEPGMVIDPGDDLDLGATGEERAGSHIQLPQLHRGVSFPPPVVLPAAAPGLRLDQPVVDQRPVDRGAGHLAITAAAHLKHQPPRPPLGMPAAQLTDRFLDLGEDPPGMLMDPVAAVLQPGDAFLPVTPKPRVHTLAAHPIPLGDPGHRNPSTGLQHGPVSLLGHAQLPQHERECQASSEANVSKIKRDSTTAYKNPCDNFLYGFKGAPHARRPTSERR